MSKYSVHLDVTFSGWLDIEANSEEEAREIAKGKFFIPYDVSYFYHLGNEVVDIELEEEGA